MNKAKLIDQVASEVTKELTEKGKLIEAGFAAFAHFVIPKDAPTIQVREMQLAFMAGADHLFSSMMNILDPGEDPTDAAAILHLVPGSITGPRIGKCAKAALTEIIEEKS